MITKEDAIAILEADDTEVLEIMNANLHYSPSSLW